MFEFERPFTVNSKGKMTGILQNRDCRLTEDADDRKKINIRLRERYAQRRAERKKEMLKMSFIGQKIAEKSKAALSAAKYRARKRDLMTPEELAEHKLAMCTYFKSRRERIKMNGPLQSIEKEILEYNNSNLPTPDRINKLVSILYRKGINNPSHRVAITLMKNALRGNDYLYFIVYLSK